MRSCLLACLVALAVCPRNAAAQGRPQDVPRVLLVGVEPTSADVPPLVARRAAEHIARDLAAQPEIDLLAIVDDPVDAATAPPPPQVADRLDEAKTAMVAARGAVDSQDYARAAEHARRAIEAYEASAAVLADEGLLVEAYQLLGVALALAGKETDAKAAFRQALAFEPTTTPDLKRHGKKVVKLYAEAQREYDKAPRSSLEITVEPESATAVVYIDGANHGEPPVKAMELGSGVHVVRIVAEGYQPHGERVLLAGGQPAKLAVTLESVTVSTAQADAVRAALRAELLKRAAGGVLDAGVKPVAARLAERAGATHLVVGMVSARPGGFTLRIFVFRAAGKKLVELDSAALDAELLELEHVTLAASRGVVAAIRDFPASRDITATITTVGDGGDGRRGDGRRLVDDGRHRKKRGDEPVEVDEGPPVWKKWWFWAGVGGVVAGAVVLGATLSSTGSADGYEGSIVLP